MTAAALTPFGFVSTPEDFRGEVATEDGAEGQPVAPPEHLNLTLLRQQAAKVKPEPPADNWTCRDLACRPTAGLVYAQAELQRSRVPADAVRETEAVELSKKTLDAELVKALSERPEVLELGRLVHDLEQCKADLVDLGLEKEQLELDLRVTGRGTMPPLKKSDKLERLGRQLAELDAKIVKRTEGNIALEKVVADERETVNQIAVAVQRQCCAVESKRLQTERDACVQELVAEIGPRLNRVMDLDSALGVHWRVGQSQQRLDAAMAAILGRPASNESPAAPATVLQQETLVTGDDCQDITEQ